MPSAPEASGTPILTTSLWPHSLGLLVGICAFSASLRPPEDAAVNAHAAIPKPMYRQFYSDLRIQLGQQRVTYACL